MRGKTFQLALERAAMAVEKGEHWSENFLKASSVSLFSQFCGLPFQLGNSVNQPQERASHFVGLAPHQVDHPPRFIRIP